METDLLWWNFKSLSSHINFLINIHTGNDEEDPRTPCSTREEPSQAEDDCSLILLEDNSGTVFIIYICNVLCSLYVAHSQMSYFSWPANIEVDDLAHSEQTLQSL